MTAVLLDHSPVLDHSVGAVRGDTASGRRRANAFTGAQVRSCQVGRARPRVTITEAQPANYSQGAVIAFLVVLATLVVAAVITIAVRWFEVTAPVEPTSASVVAVQTS